MTCVGISVVLGLAGAQLFESGDPGKSVFTSLTGYGAIADLALIVVAKDIAKGTKKTTKVTVYYTEEAGKKTAHFFEKI